MKKRQFANSDLNVNNLPQTRKEQFFDIIKHRFSLLVKIGIFILTFSIPIIALVVFSKSSVTTLVTNYNNGVITEEEYRYAYTMERLIIDSLLLAAIEILSIGIAGISRIFRQLAWGEPIFFFTDFKNGIKQNIKQFLLIFLLFGIIYFSCDITLTIFGIENAITIFILLLSLFLMIPICVINITYSPVYVCNSFRTFFNSAIIYFVSLFKNIIVTFIFLLPLAILLIPYLTYSIIIFIIALVVIYPIILLAIILFEYNIFDKFINSKDYKQLLKKGLYIGDEQTEK